MTDSAVMAIFEESPRSYFGPADHGETHWHFLNRSARPESDEARGRIESWYSKLCPALRPGVRQRLQSRDNQDFAAGIWELYLHELFRRLGYGITCEAPTPNGRNIDFLLRRGAAAFYLEATIARKSQAEQAAEARRNRIYRELDKLESQDFMLGIEIESAGANELRKVGVLRRTLADWLATLDPDETEQQWAETGEIPTLSWPDGSGWTLVFEAFPSKPEYRGQPAERPLGVFMDEPMGPIADEGRLRRALRRKRPSEYGDLALPYVVAISEEPFDADAWHWENVLFGHTAVEYCPGQPARSIRMPDGFWRGPGGRPRNRRLAAVLFASNLMPWTIDRTRLEWWDNPFANHPVPDELIPDVARRRQLVVNNGVGEFHEVQALRTAGLILGT
jgi:hypothetical protein